MYVNFTSSKDTGETRTIYVWRDNEEIRLDNATDYTINKLLKPLLDNYQKKKFFFIWYQFFFCFFNFFYLAAK